MMEGCTARGDIQIKIKNRNGYLMFLLIISKSLSEGKVELKAEGNFPSSWLGPHSLATKSHLSLSVLGYRCELSYNAYFSIL
jgi:hypothetical protein